MRLLVCGGRSYGYKENGNKDMDVFREGAKLIQSYCPTVIIHGGARGADEIAAFAADKYSIPVMRFKADWKRWGRRAGPIRNHDMLETGEPDRVLFFPGGRGTEDMVNRAKLAFVPVDDSTSTEVKQIASQ